MVFALKRLTSSIAAVLCTLLLFVSVGALGCGWQRETADSSDGQVTSSDQRDNRDQTHGIRSTRTATLARIRRLLIAGDIDGAHRGLEDYLIRNPDDAEALVLAAQTSSARGMIDEAVSMLHAAADLSPERGKSLRLDAAVLLAEHDRRKEAIERLEALVIEYPDFDDARLRLAELLSARGFRFDANEQVRQLCYRSGATPELLAGLLVPTRAYMGPMRAPDINNREEVERTGRLQVARILRDQRDVSDAYEVLRQSQLVQEKNPAALAFYGQVLLESQNFTALQQWTEQAGPECRRYPSYWMAMGGWAMRSRQYEQAVRMFAEAVLREPGDLAANDRMAQSLAAAGRADASEKFRQRGVQIDSLLQLAKQIPADPTVDIEIINQLSRGLSKIGRQVESLAWYEVALRRMGSPPDAMRRLEQARQLLPELDQLSLRRELLCGLSLEEFPLDLSLVSTDSQLDRVLPIRAANIKPPRREPSFVNVAPKVGLDFRYRNAPVPVEREFRIFQQIGAGVACLDYDLDGNVDIYAGQASGEPPVDFGTLPNLLARNLGSRFENVTLAADCDDRGYTCGVTSGDWNQDGFPDLVVGNVARNSLLINQGDGTFRPQPGDTVWNHPMYSSSLAMGDIDGDHLPDIVEVNYLDDPGIYDPIQYKPDGTPVQLPRPLYYSAAIDRVFLSRGDGSMLGQELRDSARASAATGLGVLLTNIDGEPGNEIFIVNDHRENHLWERANDSASGEGLWQNTAAVRGVAYGANGLPLGCMGIAAADFDENGRLDLHVTNFEEQWSNHYVQNDSGFFDDLVVAFGLDRPTFKMVGFGTQAIDYDNNSTVDLIIGNGHIEDYRANGSAFEMPTQVFAGEGPRFVLMQVAGDPSYWSVGHLSRGLALCDWNNDGRLDFVVTDLNQPLALLENRTDTNYHWLQLQLVGTRCERDAIGATVKASIGNRTVTKVVQAGDGYMSKNQMLVCFGLANEESIDRLEIVWPDGIRQDLTDVAADQRWLIVQGEDAFLLED